jgi:uncharacterized lipoprotein YajG
MKTLIFSFLSLVVLSGCAFMPQQANLRPAVSVLASSEGKNVTVAVRVIDERPSKSLGRRGTGLAPAAEITAAQDVAMVVQQQVVDGLRKKGFNPVDYNEHNNTRLTVEIRLLEYSTSVGFWTGGVHVKGALKAIAVRNGESYERMYRSEKEERIVVVPTAETNEEWINAALSDMLSQLFEDTGLFKFLSS